MQVLVSDTSVMIDLERAGLLSAAFKCGQEFVMPDLLFAREFGESDLGMPRNEIETRIKLWRKL